MSPPEAFSQARAYLADVPRLKKVDARDIIYRFGLTYREAERLVNEAKLARGVITLADLAPPQRRALVDPAKLDLHAIAAGPIMDSNELFLPAGRCSIEEAVAREDLRSGESA